MKPRSFLVAALILSLAAPCGAGTVSSLREAVSLGLKGNHGLKSEALSAAAAKEDIASARSRLLPKLTFEERFMRTDNPTLAFSSKLNQERFAADDFAVSSLNGPAAINDFQTSVSFEQPLYAKRAYAGLKMAKEEYSARRDDLDKNREDLAFAIVKACLAVNTASESVAAAEKGVADSSEHLRIAEARNNSGLGLLSDVLRARTGAIESEQRLVSAKKGFSVAKLALGLLLGIEEEISVEEARFDIILKEPDFYLSSAQARSDLKSMRTRAENAKTGVELAGSGYYPMAGVGGGYFLNDHSAPFGTEGTSWQVSAFIRWNIFDGGLRRHETDKARLKANEAAERLEGMKNTVSFMIREAYLGVEEARKNSELADAALRSAQEGERLVRIRYGNSLSPIVDLLDAQFMLDSARYNAIARKNDYYSALARLSFESGTILKDLGIQ